MRDYGDNSVSFVNEYNMSTFVNMNTNPVRKRRHVDIITAQKKELCRSQSIIIICYC